MGRTNPTYRDALRAIKERWAEFRRALRRRDQPRFDRLFEYAREHADASGLLNHQNPLLPALLSIDLEQEARLDDHGERLTELEQRLSETVSEQQQSSADGDTGGVERRSWRRSPSISKPPASATVVGKPRTSETEIGISTPHFVPKRQQEYIHNRRAMCNIHNFIHLQYIPHVWTNRYVKPSTRR